MIKPILGVDAAKLPCGCPASELTVVNYGVEGSGRMYFDPALAEGGYRAMWTCRKHNESEIVKRVQLIEL